MGVHHAWQNHCLCKLFDVPLLHVAQHLAQDNGLGALSVQEQQVMRAYGLDAVELLNKSARGNYWR